MSAAGRPSPWVSYVLYAAVLVAGGYAGFAGLGETRPAPFLGGLAVLAALEVVEARRHPARTPRTAAAVLLAVRLALFGVVALADGSGLSRVLFMLLPFRAYFAFGRRTALALGGATVVAIVAGYEITSPGWYARIEFVSDLLMYVVGLVIVLAAAGYATRAARLSAEAERTRLAREVHDGLGHHLTAISVLLEKADAFRERDPPSAARAVADARRSARSALEDVRRSVRTLRTGPFRLETALAELVDGFDGAVTLDCTGDEAGHGTAALFTLYRAAQEGITNARRHSGARHVAVTVHCGRETASLTVADDGCGIDGPEGDGLRGMRERVALLGGTVDVHGDGGTRLTVAIPRRGGGT